MDVQISRDCGSVKQNYNTRTVRYNGIPLDNWEEKSSEEELRLRCGRTPRTSACL